MTLPLRNLAAIVTMLAYFCAGFLVVMPRNVAAAPAQIAAHAMEHGHATGHGPTVDHQHGQDQPHHTGNAPEHTPEHAPDCAQGKSCALCHGAITTLTTLPVFDGAPAFAAAALQSHVSVTQQLPDEPPSL